MTAAESDDREALRRRLLAAALPHVPFDGWTETALLAAARDIGVSRPLALNAFPGGPAEMIAFYNREADRRMLEALEREDLAALKVRERVARAVRLRLEQNAAHREAIRRGIGFLALPQNAALGARILYRTVDAIWYAAGDRATDFNFYTKRGLLAAVYGATVLYWLNDRSEGFAESWAFLDRRIADAMRAPKLLGRLARLGEALPNPLRLFRPPPRRSRRF